MTTTETILFEFGADGGRAIVYRLPNNKVIEKGCNGGILDKENPLRKWEKEFDNWDAWHRNFMDKYRQSWIHFLPRFIHEDIKPSIQKALENYVSGNPDAGFYKERWEYALIKRPWQW